MLLMQIKQKHLKTQIKRYQIFYKYLLSIKPFKICTFRKSKINDYGLKIWIKALSILRRLKSNFTMLKKRIFLKNKIKLKIQEKWTRIALPLKLNKSSFQIQPIMRKNWWHMDTLSLYFYTTTFENRVF